MLWDLGRIIPEAQVYSDDWGCGAYSLPHWFALSWPPKLGTTSIQVKELVPVVIADGKEWTGKVVVFKVDNRAVVDILNVCIAGSPI